jgi:hypothetical protein
MQSATHLDFEALAARWIVKYPAQSQRILKALQLAKRPGQVAALGGDLYLVRSSRGDSWYQVAPGSCECADHCFRADDGIRCAHRWALSLLWLLSALPAPPAPKSDYTRQELRADLATVAPLAGISPDYGDAAKRWRQADRARRNKRQATWLKAHEESQAKLRWQVAKSDLLNKSVQG